MLERVLLKFTWKYEKRVITLIDKDRGSYFSIPIAYADSLARALIAFKTAHRIELIEHKQLMLTNSRMNTKLVKEIVKQLRKEKTSLKIIIKDLKSRKKIKNMQLELNVEENKA